MKLVLVEWVDSYGCSATWEQFSTPLDQPRVMTCRSVGWLAHDGDDAKVLVPHVAQLGDAPPSQGCGDMTIPSRAVVRMVDLHEPAAEAAPPGAAAGRRTPKSPRTKQRTSA